MAPLIVEMDEICIYVYCGEHLPPHFHAFYADEEVLININTGKILIGVFPIKKLKSIKE